MRKLKLSGEERTSLDETIKRAAAAFGNPHHHAGLGLRSLGHDLYECRWSGLGKGGLHFRVVFKKLATRPTTLFFDMIGNHRDVLRYLHG